VLERRAQRRRQGAKRQKAAQRSRIGEIKDVKKSYGGKIEVVQAYRKDRAALVKLRHYFNVGKAS
jgi:hypothetical protein